MFSWKYKFFEQQKLHYKSVVTAQFPPQGRVGSQKGAKGFIDCIFCPNFSLQGGLILSNGVVDLSQQNFMQKLLTLRIQILMGFFNF